GCTIVESDLGEWIIQLDEDPPSHIVAPALHKDRDAVHETFTAHGYTGSNDPTELGRYARQELRKDFLKAEVGITGCNFAIAESGAVGLVTNEGNGRMVTSLPDTVISVMGMERVVPSYEEFEVLVNMLCRSAVGQRLTSYITTFAGTRTVGEVDGPEEFHLVIVDNKRSGILGTQFQSVLQCIRCAACINVCPVYRHIGGHAYGSIYPGPIGAVLAPLLDGYENYKELPYASSLCGACTEACPVKIPLHELLIEHRRVIVEEKKQSPFVERIAMKGFAVTASSPFLFEAAEHVAPFATSLFATSGQIEKGLPAWTDSKDLPQPNKQTVRDWFKKRGNA
ncbi:MAG: LutB/LldF family L-lactate oxidation iron-sulfur protein, partial [Exiguobacterium sp.]